MLLGLCGNKTVPKILMFLLVNGKCYGTQLSRLLRTPLTPIQNALSRLEKGGLLTSYYEGNTKVFLLDPAMPCLPELEQLLKKQYMLLPPEEKKKYAALQEDRHQGKRMQILLSFWKKLTKVGNLSFIARSKSEAGGWSGKGKGSVTVTQDQSNVLIFHEKGEWTSKEGKDLVFHNLFRWTLDKDTGMLALEHCRRGIQHPVFLFHLAPSSHRSLASVDAHLCEGDVYFGTLSFDDHSLRLNWRVIGPKKNEELDYYYL